MKKFSILRNSILIIIIAFLSMSCSLSRKTAKNIQNELQNEKIQRYRTIIKKDNLKLTGILLIKKKENILIGSLINEFGLRVFNFTLKKSKAHITTSISQLDKWYIKRSMGKYLYKILIQDNKENHKEMIYTKKGITIKLKKI
ncbi:hypothetical protein E0494_03105 [Marinilabiliaceae bacterium JC040]|nr:hypothetical protein [Marinilabiliaceae bacterium JC040]